MRSCRVNAFSLCQRVLMVLCPSMQVTQIAVHQLRPDLGLLASADTETHAQGETETDGQLGSDPANAGVAPGAGAGPGSGWGGWLSRSWLWRRWTSCVALTVAVAGCGGVLQWLWCKNGRNWSGIDGVTVAVVQKWTKSESY